MPGGKTIIVIRNDTAANWLALNPVLDLNEHGYERDEIVSLLREDGIKYKIGDGVRHWSELPYETSAITNTVLESIADISVKYATTTNLTANYTNGTAGVGRKLTSTVNAVFPVTDGQTPALNDEVLVKNQTDKRQNGPYKITVLGNAGTTPWELTGLDTGDEQDELNEQVIFVIHGLPVNKNVSRYFTQITPDPVVGTDDIIYQKGIGTGGAGTAITTVKQTLSSADLLGLSAGVSISSLFPVLTGRIYRIIDAFIKMSASGSAYDDDPENNIFLTDSSGTIPNNAFASFSQTILQETTGKVANAQFFWNNVLFDPTTDDFFIKSFNDATGGTKTATLYVSYYIAIL